MRMTSPEATAHRASAIFGEKWYSSSKARIQFRMLRREVLRRGRACGRARAMGREIATRGP